MQVSIQADRSHVDQLEQLIARDRSSAGESRRPLARVPLRTAEYAVPLRVLLKQRWREERRACVALLGMMAVLSGLLGFYVFAPPSRASFRSADVPRSERAAAQSERIPSQSAPAPVTAPRPAVIAAPERPSATPSAPSLSVQLRLQRADLWLRIGTPRAAEEARRLLESALAERPDSAHGQAALAQACLILEDQSCARGAIEEAQRARPWRAGYRVLSRQIERAFRASP